jgi:hypothetical protein
LELLVLVFTPDNLHPEIFPGVKLFISTFTDFGDPETIIYFLSSYLVGLP